MQKVRHACLVVLGVLAAALPAVGEGYRLGEPWEPEIERGVEAQRREIRRGVSAESLVGRANRAARRNADAVKLYLLARAYGVRAQWHRGQAQMVRGEARRQEHAAAARDDQASAMDTYGEVLARAPRCYYAHHDRGVLVLQANPEARRAAFEHFSRAYRLNERYTPTVRQLIQLYLAGKQYGVAVPLIQQLLQLDPSDEEARARLVAAYSSLEKHAEAYRELEAMLARRPGNLQLLALRAQLDVRTGKLERGIESYKRLARANPSVPTPYVGILEAVRKQTEAGQEPDAGNYLFALKGMRRLLRDRDEIARVDQDIRRVEHLMAQPRGGTPTGPPTTAQLLHQLAGPDEKGRLRAMLFLLTREEPANGEVVRAIAGHLGPSQEPSAPVRVVAVRGLGRLTGSKLAPLLRHSLADPEPAVRVETIDTLAAIGERDPSITGPLIAILGRQTGVRETGVAAAARSAVLRLANVTLPDVGEESDDGAWRRAFAAWWDGPHGVDVQIRALDQYHRLGDRTPHEILGPYLASPDFFVFQAAYAALGRSAAAVRDAALARWYAQRPVFATERLRKEQFAALKAEMDAWLARRPGQ